MYSPGFEGRAGRLVVGLNPQRPVRRSVPRISGSRRQPVGHGARQRARVRGRAEARRSARRDRSCEDGILLERLSRVSDAADADPRARGRHAHRKRRPLALPNASASSSCTATACACSSWSTRCWISRGSRRAVFRPSFNRPISPRSPPIWRARFDRRSNAPAWSSSSTVRRCESRCTSTATCGRRSS